MLQIKIKAMKGANVETMDSSGTPRIQPNIAINP